MVVDFKDTETNQEGIYHFFVNGSRIALLKHVVTNDSTENYPLKLYAINRLVNVPLHGIELTDFTDSRLTRQRNQVAELSSVDVIDNTTRLM